MDFSTDIDPVKLRKFIKDNPYALTVVKVDTNVNCIACVLHSWKQFVLVLVSDVKISDEDTVWTEIENVFMGRDVNEYSNTYDKIFDFMREQMSSLDLSKEYLKNIESCNIDYPKHLRVFCFDKKSTTWKLCKRSPVSYKLSTMYPNTYLKIVM